MTYECLVTNTVLSIGAQAMLNKRAAEGRRVVGVTGSSGITTFGFERAKP